MDIKIPQPKKVALCFMSLDEKISSKQYERLILEELNFDIETYFRHEINPLQYQSFSQMVNESINETESEFMIFINPKTLVTSEDINFIIEKLCSGNCFASLFGFAFFGATKELFRNVGMLDEIFLGSEYEDDDFLIRLRIFDKKVYWGQNWDKYNFHWSYCPPNRGSSLTNFWKKWRWKDNSYTTSEMTNKIKKISNRHSPRNYEIYNSWSNFSESWGEGDIWNKVMSCSIQNSDKIEEMIPSQLSIEFKFENNEFYVNFMSDVNTAISCYLVRTNLNGRTPIHMLLIHSNTWHKIPISEGIIDLELRFYHDGNLIYINEINDGSSNTLEFNLPSSVLTGKKEGLLTYRNILLAQSPNITKEFSTILGEFSTIIEIGFNRGGLSLWLNDNKPKDSKLICYDITNEFLLVSPEEEIDFRIKDCYQDVNINEIKLEIGREGKTLVLCDGGDKNFEFNTFSKFLKVGDVIMCHDYCENLEEYNQIANKIKWPTPGESFYDFIKNSIEENHLIEYKYNEFKNILWGSFIKTENKNPGYPDLTFKNTKKDEILLSILVSSLVERNENFLSKLINSLENQIANKPVELLVFSDNAQRPVGTKRNDLLKLSNGKYVCFVDDDDRVSDSYVDDILREILKWEPDVVVFDVEISFNGFNPKLVKYGREFDYCETPEAYYRHPNHLMVHKRENITEYYRDIKTGEDDEWALRMLPRIVTQSRIDKILYYYDFDTNTKKYFE